MRQDDRALSFRTGFELDRQMAQNDPMIDIVLPSRTIMNAPTSIAASTLETAPTGISESRA